MTPTPAQPPQEPHHGPAAPARSSPSAGPERPSWVTPCSLELSGGWCPLALGRLPSIVASRLTTMAARLISRTWRVSRKAPPETPEQVIKAVYPSWDPNSLNPQGTPPPVPL